MLLIAADRRSVDVDTVLGVGHVNGLVDLNAHPPGENLAAVLADRISVIHPNLWYLPTGGISGGEPLSMDLMRALLKLAAHLHLSVVVDAPPALRNADGLELAALVDGVVVTAVPRRTGRSDLGELRGQLGRVGAHVFGALAIEAEPTELLSQGTVDLEHGETQSGLGSSPSAPSGGRLSRVHQSKGAIAESSEPDDEAEPVIPETPGVAAPEPDAVESDPSSEAESADDESGPVGMAADSFAMGPAPDGPGAAAPANLAATDSSRDRPDGLFTRAVPGLASEPPGVTQRVRAVIVDD